MPTEPCRGTFTTPAVMPATLEGMPLACRQHYSTLFTCASANCVCPDPNAPLLFCHVCGEPACGVARAALPSPYIGPLSRLGLLSIPPVRYVAQDSWLASWSLWTEFFMCPPRGMLPWETPPRVLRSTPVGLGRDLFCFQAACMHAY